MKVLSLQPVKIALRTLSDKDRRQVFAWFDHLKNWKNDETVRNNSHLLADSDDVYVLKTTSDVRIFFKLQEDQITVLDIAMKSTIVNSGVDSE
jgi:mRNA-degrading endonuclease RelE of RelBE toxin-antitoxin system